MSGITIIAVAFFELGCFLRGKFRVQRHSFVVILQCAVWVVLLRSGLATIIVCCREIRFAGWIALS